MVDYRKWDHIEVSDDEDDTHPNIYTPSLFRWRHQDRIRRMEDRKREEEQLNKKKTEHAKNLAEAKSKLAEAQANSSLDVKSLEMAVTNLENEGFKIKAQEVEFQKKGEQIPWNVDTLSHDGFSKTFINKDKTETKAQSSTEEINAVVQKFVDENEKELKEFGMLKRYEDSRQFLNTHAQLICEEAGIYLVEWCLDLEMEKKQDIMENVAHQTVCLQQLLKLAKELHRDPKGCSDVFYSRMRTLTPELKTSFILEVQIFKGRIKKRAVEKLEEAIMYKEVKEKRKGPGGLDPYEVFESLPEDLKKCFQLKSTALLQETISKMDEESVSYHMNRCVDSGLWIPVESVDDNEPGGSNTASTSE